SAACDAAVKREQIRRRLARQAVLLIQQFSRFYDAGVSGSREETLKRALATVNALGGALRGEDGYRSPGHFIDAHAVSERAFYQPLPAVASQPGLQQTDRRARSPSVPDIFAELETKEDETPTAENGRGTAGTFAQKAVQTWVRDVRQFAADEGDPR